MFRVGYEYKFIKFLIVGIFCVNNKEIERLVELDNIVFIRVIYLYFLFNMFGLRIRIF